MKNVAQEAAHHAEALAKMAAEETGFGNWQDKVLKTVSPRCASTTPSKI